ncbi:ABC transporter substrate-binding protein [Sporomusa termitida]|uniref:ABC transporter, substrate-binding protein, aliphatic sulfonates family n=1 Tax=Sporomusa termitida TaxID=2377 RepID=A0A517E1A0_9FIRM|nr:ABC transporter substrate-binding protein [Sporomusa termitida]QDR83384.1 ABC transporter, substrate-binding protein, aliphatic sulfonates family [Sporomusa termitida]
MKKVLTTMSALALIAVFTLLLVGWGGASVSAAPAPLTRIVVADTPSTHHLNLYVAKEKGLFDKYGLDVVIREVQDASAARDAVISRAADIYWACPTAVMTAVARGAPIEFIAQVKKPCTSVLAVSPNSGIRTVADLNGKTIGGLSPSCCAVIFIQKLAKDAGVSFKLVNLAGGAAIAALKANQVDGIIVEEPHASIAELAGYTTLFRDKLQDSTCRTINANKYFIDQNTDAAKKFIKAIDEANALIRQNPVAEDIVQIAVKYTRAPAEAIRRGNHRLGFTTQLTTDLHKALGDFLVEQKIINKNPIPGAFAEEFKGITW